jgi:hypothetical protein
MVSAQVCTDSPFSMGREVPRLQNREATVDLPKRISVTGSELFIVEINEQGRCFCLNESPRRCLARRSRGFLSTNQRLAVF